MPFFIEIIGGAEGDRTPDLMTASHALSQLSYGPTFQNQVANSLVNPPSTAKSARVARAQKSVKLHQ
jgi:hypothetical protein